MVDTGDHYRSDGDDCVYRVVGTGDPVALLRVTDADGRRAHSGELRRVDRDMLDAGFAPAADPDAGVSIRRAIRGLLQGLYWSVRRLV